MQAEKEARKAEKKAHKAEKEAAAKAAMKAAENMSPAEIQQAEEEAAVISVQADVRHHRTDLREVMKSQSVPPTRK